MEKTLTPKLKLNKEVITQLAPPASKPAAGGKGRVKLTCCDQLSYASSPYHRY